MDPWSWLLYGAAPAEAHVPGQEEDASPRAAAAALLCQLPAQEAAFT